MVVLIKTRQAVRHPADVSGHGIGIFQPLFLMVGNAVAAPSMQRAVPGADTRGIPRIQPGGAARAFVKYTQFHFILDPVNASQMIVFAHIVYSLI